MDSKPNRLYLTILGGISILIFVAPFYGTIFAGEEVQIIIVNRTGERWDISQAVSIGFDPKKFEFGIGRHAFHPLKESFIEIDEIEFVSSPTLFHLRDLALDQVNDLSGKYGLILSRIPAQEDRPSF
jgi:hypothetical protein